MGEVFKSYEYGLPGLFYSRTRFMDLTLVIKEDAFTRKVVMYGFNISEKVGILTVVEDALIITDGMIP